MKLSREEIEKIANSVNLEFKDRKSEKKYIKCINDKSRNSVIDYMDRWAKVMQYYIKNKGYDVATIAQETKDCCDFDGISGFMYGCVVNNLCQVWKYGDELRNWHNDEYKFKGDGVANPALLNVEEEL